MEEPIQFKINSNEHNSDTTADVWYVVSFPLLSTKAAGGYLKGKREKKNVCEVHHTYSFRFSEDENLILYFGKGELVVKWLCLRRRVTVRKRSNLSAPHLYFTGFLHSLYELFTAIGWWNKSQTMTGCRERVQLNRDEESDQDEKGLRRALRGEVWAHQLPPYCRVTALNRVRNWVPKKLLFLERTIADYETLVLLRLPGLVGSHVKLSWILPE